MGDWTSLWRIRRRTAGKSIYDGLPEPGLSRSAGAPAFSDARKVSVQQLYILTGTFTMVRRMYWEGRDGRNRIFAVGCALVRADKMELEGFSEAFQRCIWDAH